PDDPTTPAPTTPAPTPPPSDVFDFDGPVPTNLFIVSIDTMRWDRIGRYSGSPSMTPFLDSLLEQSVVLDAHHSCSNWTAPSMLCATSGQSPLDAGVFIPRNARQLPTVARLLREDGFDTRLVSGNGWYLHGHFFDPHKPLCPPEDYRQGEDELPPLGFDLCWEYHEALDAMWRDGTPEQQATFRAHVELRYDGDVRFMDDQIRRMWTQLESRSALDDTLVMFFSDHGEQFMDRRPVVDHPWDLFAEENRALGAFWAKNLAPRSYSGRTQHEDLAATLYTLFDAIPERPFSGLPVGTAPPIGRFDSCTTTTTSTSWL
ncbi:MAG: sulfatase-like hydrolase/transferase, partial [Myxococcota bacterium]